MTDPGVPSYHEPLPSYLCQETKVFSKWITAEEKRKFKSISMKIAALVDSPQRVFLGRAQHLYSISRQTKGSGAHSDIAIVMLG